MEMIHRNNILQDAKDVINGERQKDYGDASKCFEMIASLWTTYFDGQITITPTDVGFMMILLKIARATNGERLGYDNFVDICGYAALTAEISDEFFVRSLRNRFNQEN